LRGGSWVDLEDDLRSSSRDGDIPVKEDDDFGFRVASP
jgi:formylglycine-generating enzyme required for sulfatase activity